MKPIDEVTLKGKGADKAEMCEHCKTFNWVFTHFFYCGIPRREFIGLDECQDEPCLSSDWERCPLNKGVTDDVYGNPGGVDHCLNPPPEPPPSKDTDANTINKAEGLPPPWLAWYVMGLVLVVSVAYIAKKLAEMGLINW